MRWISSLLLWMISIGFLGLIGVVCVAVYILNMYGQDLPDYRQLKDYKPPVMTRIYAGDGRLMAEYAQEKRVFVPIEKIPERVQQAFLSAEDQNFYSHNGLDYRAIARAMLSNLKNFGQGRRPEGASTITQQVAKNFLLSGEVSYRRKIREAFLALRMEKALGKKRLLELYLNEIYLGSGSYGVSAAALNYFNKSLKELTIAEVAYLAALPKAPNNYNIIRNHDKALERRNWVIGRMAEDGYISEGQALLAKKTPLQMIRRHAADTVSASYFSEEIRRILERHYGEDGLYGGGLSVRTSLDPRLQDIAVRSLRDGLGAYDRRHGYRGPLSHLETVQDWQTQLSDIARPDGAIKGWFVAVVLESGSKNAKIGLRDGSEASLPLDEVKWARKSLEDHKLGKEVSKVSDVLQVGDVILVEKLETSTKSGEKEVSWALRQVPLVQGGIIALDPHTGRILAMQGGWKHDKSEFNRATQAWRQPGSAFKPFVYLAALDKGFTPATLVLDAPFVLDQGHGMRKWRPSNYSNVYYGPTPIRVGVEKSRNLMTVRLADYVGMDTIVSYARTFGIVDDMKPHLANALGAGETTLLRMTAAYAMLVNGGKKVQPTLIDRIQDRRGHTVFRHDRRDCEGCGPLIPWDGTPAPSVPDDRVQIADPRTSYQIVSILEGVVERGTAQRLKSLGRPLAGKTGTTNESKDTWFIGFSPDLVVGVFVGFDEPVPMGHKETGSSVSAPVFKMFMQEALEGKPPIPFRVPPGIRHVQINADTGARARPGDKDVIWEAFVVGTEPTDEMYILDGKGISLMPAVAGTSQDAATTGTGGLY